MWPLPLALVCSPKLLLILLRYLSCSEKESSLRCAAAGEC